MKKTRRRPWFRIHLSTAMVLMFATGGLIWANVRDQVSYIPPVDNFNPQDIFSHRTMFLKNPLPKYGFPFVCVDKWEFPLGDGFMVHYYPWLICVDILVAVVILASLWFALERWITWRKPSTS